jgi:hypothetical protein
MPTIRPAARSKQVSPITGSNSITTCLTTFSFAIVTQDYDNNDNANGTDKLSDRLPRQAAPPHHRRERAGTAAHQIKSLTQQNKNGARFLCFMCAFNISHRVPLTSWRLRLHPFLRPQAQDKLSSFSRPGSLAPSTGTSRTRHPSWVGGGAY